MANSAMSQMGSAPPAVRILLVEDNPGDVYLLEKALEQRHLRYELICYPDGDEAMRALTKDDCVIPDLILL